MMIGKYGKSFTALLAAAALFFSGCSGQQADRAKGDGETDGGAAVQMGRYVEDFTESSVELNRSGALTRLEDGRIAVFSYNYGPYLSSDEGKTWEPWQTEWYQENCDYISYQCAAIAPDGTMFVGYRDYSDAALEEAGQESGPEQETAAEEEAAAGQEAAEKQQEEDSGAEDTTGGFVSCMEYQLIAPDGSSRKIELEELSGRNEEDFMMGCWYAPDKTLYAASFEHLYEVSEDGETLTALLEPEPYAEQLCFLGEDIMLVVTNQGALVYDRKNRTVLESDEVLDEFIKEQVDANGGVLKYASDNYNVYLAAGEGEGMYLVCEDGIYSHALGGGMLEKIVEGSLCSLGDPSQAVFGMLPLADNRFWVLYRDAVGVYRYDADMPTLPEKELKVYGLEKDDVVQRAVSLFQKAHQDVYVNYEVGLDENSGQTKEDVIKTLNTEILAGHGPDVLILDGFPMDSYMEKGLLRDISQVLWQAEEKEALFENIAGAFAQDEKVFAIPMRCKIPAVVGPAAEVEKMTGLAGIADAAKSMRSRKESGSVTGTMEEASTLELLAMASAPAWEKADGSVDQEAVREYFEQAKRFFDAEDAGVTQEEREMWKDARYSGSDGRIEDDVLMLIDNNAYQAFLQEDRMGLGYINDMWGLEVMFSVRRQGTDLACDTLKGQAQQVFYPYTIAGISASAKEPELAEEFLEIMLSDAAASGEGFPVNRAALEENLALNNDGDGGIIGMMVVTGDDGDMRELTIYQLTAEEVAWLYETLEALKTPYLQNETLETAVLEVGEKFLRGEMDIEAALDEVQNRVKLSMAE